MHHSHRWVDRIKEIFYSDQLKYWKPWPSMLSALLRLCCSSIVQFSMQSKIVGSFCATQKCKRKFVFVWAPATAHRHLRFICVNQSTAKQKKTDVIGLIDVVSPLLALVVCQNYWCIFAAQERRDVYSHAKWRCVRVRRPSSIPPKLLFSS